MIQVAAGILEDNHKRFLIGKRKLDAKHYPERWEFPGGKQKEHEKCISITLQRELKEELNIRISVGHLNMVWEGEHPDFKDYYLTFFKVYYFTGIPQLIEHDGLMWCTKEEILERNDLVNGLMKDVLRLV